MDENRIMRSMEQARHYLARAVALPVYAFGGIQAQ